MAKFQRTTVYCWECGEANQIAMHPSDMDGLRHLKRERCRKCRAPLVSTIGKIRRQMDIFDADPGLQRQVKTRIHTKSRG